MRMLLLISACFVATNAGAADRRVPAKFVGEWCRVDQTLNKQGSISTITYRRGACGGGKRYGNWLRVRAGGLEEQETLCDVVASIPEGNGNWQVQLSCLGDGDQYNIINVRLSLAHGHLIERFLD